jgi:hypothetical protein
MVKSIINKLDKAWTWWSTLGCVDDDEIDEIAISCLKGKERENYSKIILMRIKERNEKK